MANRDAGPTITVSDHSGSAARAPLWHGAGPFDLDDGAAYRRWRDRKLASRPADPAKLVVEVPSLGEPPKAVRDAIIDRCRRANMAIYACADGGPDGAGDARGCLAEFAAAFGLVRLDRNLGADEDGLTALEVRDAQSGGEYIPYSSKALSWHTDGYYNSADAQVRGMVLHCVRPAAEGGVNALMDHEIAYIRLRDEDPAWVAALMHPEAMTIPANRLGGREVRPARTGPVISVDPGTGALHMRYSARKVNVVWRDDAATRAAVARLERLLDSGEDVLHWRLEAGQGYIANNVLHNRSAFRDNPESGRGRLIYRARYFDRIGGTGPHDG